MALRQQQARVGLGNSYQVAWTRKLGECMGEATIGEYEDFLNMDGADKRWWDYSALFKKASSRYRLACNCGFSIFAQ